jgi:hypothetical protein
VCKESGGGAVCEHGRERAKSAEAVAYASMAGNGQRAKSAEAVA